MRILVVEPLAAEGLELLRRHHDVDERLGLPRDEIAAILPEYDALVVRSQVKVDAALIAAGTRLVVIGRAGVGVDNVDLEAATRAGVVVVNAPTGNTIAAAELTLALLFGLARKTAAADASMRRGEWKRSQFTGMELRGKTLGIVGFGRIGRRVGELAHAFGMSVMAHDAFPGADPGFAPFAWAGLDEVFSDSDVVSLHCPLTSENQRFVNRDLLQRMRPTALFVNAARGSLVNEADLAAALKTGRIAGAVVDVLSAEPVRPENPLLSAPNIVITPHLAWAAREARQRLMRTTAENVRAFLEGRPQHLVNGGWLGK